MQKTNLSWEETKERAQKVVQDIFLIHSSMDAMPWKIFGVPRGGIPAALIVSQILMGRNISTIMVQDSNTSDMVIDDIVDTGQTRNRFPNSDFYALVDKTTKQDKDIGWVVFPWEKMAGEDGPEENIIRILEYIGEDPKREGLKDTPKRIIKSYQKLYGGYAQNIKDFETTFESECDEMILLKGIEFYSTCLAGSTFIDTPKGRIPINRIKDGEFVYCWDEDNCQMTIARCVAPRITGHDKRLWRVYTDKDTILCTSSHKFLTHNRGWVKAKNMTAGDSIIALNKGTIVHNGKIPRAYIVWTGRHKQIPEHRFIYEAINGPIGENHIHHINKKPNDNSPENLTALRNSKHNAFHRMTDGPTGFALFTDEQRQKMRKKQTQGIRKSQTEEVRKKRASSIKTYWDSLTPKQRADRNHRVLLVEKTEWFEDVWCMDVPGYENFVANGMVVHNCEHHMLPFFGKAHIAYIPDKKIIGISKLARILEMFARRLQIQERLCFQVTEALEELIAPKGTACILEAQHFCMTSRGVEKQKSVMVTSSLTGVLRTDPRARNEFMSMVKG